MANRPHIRNFLKVTTKVLEQFKHITCPLGSQEFFLHGWDKIPPPCLRRGTQHIFLDKTPFQYISSQYFRRHKCILCEIICRSSRYGGIGRVDREGCSIVPFRSGQNELKEYH